MSLGFPLLEMEECFQPRLSASAEVHTPGTQPASTGFCFVFSNCCLACFLGFFPGCHLQTPTVQPFRVLIIQQLGR